MIGVAGEGDVEAVLHSDQPLHRMRRGRVHADLPVPVQGHEGKRRVDLVADHVEIERIAFGNARPVVHAGAAERIDAHAHAGAADQVEVEHVAQVFDVRSEEHTSELQSLMRISYAVYCLKQKKQLKLRTKRKIMRLYKITT